MKQLLYYVLLLAAMVYLARQVRKPTKWVGRLFARLMNLSHSSLTDWGLMHVRIEKPFIILDVGCGGGRTIQKLAELAQEGKIYGVDYAQGSVATATAINQSLMEAGRVEIHQASVSQLPFPDAKFDLVITAESLYYWPDPVRDMQEVARVIKPGGMLIMIAESYKNNRFDKVQRPIMKLIGAAQFSPDEHRDLFAKAGFIDIQIFEEQKKGWICGIGRRA